MKTIQVNLKDRSYPIHIESGLLQKLPDYLKEANHGQKWVIISQHRILDLFRDDLQSLLQNSDFNCASITIPAGEAAKSLNEYRRIISQMVELGCDRSTTILALGGGVVGDVAGFAAATFMRGLEYFQIPTTLLAMVDSSIGGKTGINISEGKNLVGAIYQPKGVLIDPDNLKSLPREEIVAGLGEVIKYGAIYDRDFFSNISVWMEDLDSFPFEKAITRSCAIKADVVSKDEHEKGMRRILNFGHTIGHALEAHLGYGKLRHGEAVAYGMLCAGYISEKLGHLSSKEAGLLFETIQMLPLPKIGQQNSEHLINYIRTDKKNEKGVLNFVVLNGLGNAMTSNEVNEHLIKESLKVLS